MNGTANTTPHVTLALDDVQAAGGVEQAIEAWSAEDDLTSSGVVGSSFSASGPGPGYSRQHGSEDYAAEAMRGGALYYIDSTTGRVASSPQWAESGDEFYCAEAHDIEWTGESQVCLECPEIDDAMEHPEAVAMMAQAVIDHHGPCSDRPAWHAMLSLMRDAASEIEDIDIDIDALLID